MRGFKNIIFDFGGVIIDIDYNRTISAFQNLGIRNFEERSLKLIQSGLFDDLETGAVTPEEFRQQIRNISDEPLTDAQINTAWNAILVDVPEEKINFLDQLKSDHRLFLLSNTNKIHEKTFTEMIMKKFGENVLTKIFERVYFSHHLKLRKPDPEIFRYVLKANNLEASETLFVDDSLQHIEAAKEVGLQTYHYKIGNSLQSIFND